MSGDLEELAEEFPEDFETLDQYELLRFGKQITNPAASGFIVLLHVRTKQVVWLPVDGVSLTQDIDSPDKCNVWYDREPFTVNVGLDAVATDIMNSREGLWALEQDAKTGT